MSSKHQRTKGNIKPASSARAAEILGGHVGGSLFGFSGPPVATGDEENDIGIDSEMRVVLKKLRKKDTATKLKALQDLFKLCEGLSVEEIVAALPHWMRSYSKLAIDFDRRVRENSHLAAELISGKVGRQLAPYVKLVLPCWICCACDPHPPAAAAASNAMSAAFPTLKKKSDAVVYCKDAIFKYLDENLFEHSPATLSDPATTPAEEMQAKYERVVATSLRGLGFMMGLLTKEQNEQVTEKYKMLMDRSKLWKYSKHKANVIRSAFYTLLSHACQHLPSSVLSPICGKICSTALAGIGEMEQSVCIAGWEAALQVLNTVDDIWSHVNLRKAVLPRLWSVFKQRGGGLAELIYPNVLPFLSQLPPEVLIDKGFFNEFFSNMRNGVSLDSLRLAQASLPAVVSSYMECLRYCVVQVISKRAGEHQLTFLEHLLCGQVLPLVEAALFGSSDNAHWKSVVFSEVASLLSFLIKKGHQEGEQYIVENFWHGLKNIVLTVIEEIVCGRSCLIDFFTQLCSLYDAFDSESDSADYDAVHSILRTAFEILKRISFTFSSDHLSVLCSLLTTVKKPTRFFTTKPDGDEDAVEAALTFIRSTLYPVLQRREETENRRESATKILLALLPCLGNQQAILTELQTALSLNLVGCFLDVALHCDSEILTPWLQSSSVEEFILSRFSSLLDGDEGVSNDADWNVLLSVVDDKGSLFSKRFRCQIVKSIHQNLESKLTSAELESGVFLERICGVIVKYFENLTESVLTEVVDVFVIVFKCRISFPDQTLVKCWRTCCKAMAKVDKGANALDKLLEWIHAEQRDLQTSERATCLATACTELAILAPNKPLLLLSVLPKHNLWEELRQNASVEGLCAGPLVCGGLSLCALSRRSVLGLNSSTVGKEAREHKLLAVFTAELVREGCGAVDGLSIEEVKVLVLELLWQLQAQKNAVQFGVGICSGDTLLSACEKALDVLAEPQQIDDLFYMTQHRATVEGHLWSQVLGSLFAFAIKKEYPFDSPLHASFMCSKTRLSFYELHSLQMVVCGLERALAESPATVSPTVSVFCQQLITSPVAMGIFDCNFKSQLASCLFGLCLIHCALRLGRQTASVDSKVIIPQIVDQLMIWRDKSDVFLFQTSVDKASPVELAFNVEVCHFLQLAVTQGAHNLVPSHWDFLLCALVSWLQTCQEGFADETISNSLGFRSLLYHSCWLLFFTTDTLENADKAASLPPNLPTEWREFFAEAAYQIVIPMFFRAAEMSSNFPSADMVTGSISFATGHTPLEILKRTKPGSENSSLFDDFCQLLSSPIRSVQVAASKCLRKLCSEIVFNDKAAVKSLSESEESIDPESSSIRIPPGLLRVSDQLFNEVMILLDNADADEPSLLKSRLESPCVGYCLSWNVILHLFHQANHSLRVHYSWSVKEEKRLANLFHLLFSLMPNGSRTAQCISKVAGSTEQQTARLGNGHVNFWEVSEGWEPVEELSSSVYLKCLQLLPALVRQWHAGLSKNTASDVDKFTSQFVSPHVVQKELASIQESAYSSENMLVRIRSATREVIATYTIGEVSMELIVTLAQNYPLSPVKVDCGRRIRVAQSQWRNWMLQLHTFLSHQNGSILDGLILWKDNLDKKFAGLDDCMICFSVIHGANCSIPKLQCRTCKKKFHSACLYKWFSTSNASSCPLCRNLF